MQAWLLEQIGSLDHLKLGEAADPVAGPGQVVLEVEFAAINPADHYLALGQYPARPKLPHILGRDAIGKVISVGPGVEGVAPGDRRLLLRSEIGVNLPGTLAQRVAVPVEPLVVPPDGWSPEQAAAAPLVYLTAYQALTCWGELPPSVVLITGASGGVGVASVQLARATGHTVIGTSRDPAKSQKLRELGAQLVVDPNDEQWRQKVKDFLGRRRVDLAIDNIGGPLFNQVLETLGEHGRVSCVGQLAGPVPQFKTASLFFKRLRVGGVSVGAYTPAESQAAWAEILKLLAKTGARPIIDSVWEFAQLKEAFARLNKGPMGKVLIKMP